MTASRIRNATALEQSLHEAPLALPAVQDDEHEIRFAELGPADHVGQALPLGQLLKIADIRGRGSHRGHEQAPLLRGVHRAGDGVHDRNVVIPVA